MIAVLRRIPPSVPLTLGVLAIAGVAGIARFGSLPNALAYVRGERLLLDSAQKSFGRAAQGEKQVVSFRLTNIASRPITLLGARSTCTCTSAGELPISIAPGQTGEVRAAVNTAGRTGDLREMLHVYTDDPNDQDLDLIVVGQILAPKGGEASPPPKLASSH